MRAWNWLACVLTFLSLSGCAGRPLTSKSATPAPAVSAVQWDRKTVHDAVALSIRCTQKSSPHEFETRRPNLRVRETHPAFFGCYDWHSGVHGHWAMLRVLHSFKNLEDRAAIGKILDDHFTPANIARELKFFEANRSYEIPYGAAWFLRLVTELRASPHPKAPRWYKALAPLEHHLAAKLDGYFRSLTRPIREGAHGNTAFSMMHAYDYARMVGNERLLATIRTTARQLFGGDRQCPTAYEPSQYDFLSPCLAEADLMRRVLDTEFAAWFRTFLPTIEEAFFDHPAEPADPKDPHLGHLIGLMFHKAWTMNALAREFPEGPLARSLLRGARIHEARGFELMFDSGYGGEHWLATYLIYLKTEDLHDGG